MRYLQIYIINQHKDLLFRLASRENDDQWMRGVTFIKHRIEQLFGCGCKRCQTWYAEMVWVGIWNIRLRVTGCLHVETWMRLELNDRGSTRSSRQTFVGK